MFERNRVDSRAETLIAIEVTLADGSLVAGRAVLAPGKGVHKLLDGDEGFIYIDSFEGEGSFIPKTDIRALKVLTKIKSQTIALPIPDARNFDPYRVLGLEPGATFDNVREAYHALSKMYHPDRYASVELPREVKTYLEGMSKNVNAAFVALKHLGQKTQPVYSRGA